MHDNIGIRYESSDIMDDTVLLLRYNCPDPSCDQYCQGWPDLHRHVKQAHGKKICDLCSRHKKVFTHEHELLTDPELQKHMKKGDDNPGAIDQSGFKGHPLCRFCGERFYGEDELYVHCRNKHERCFLCDRRDGAQPSYYQNFEALSKHFRTEHFPCLERECQEQKFVVFDTEMDFKAHQLEVHGNSLSKDVRRDARVVDMASFEYRAPYVQERRGGGSQREQRAEREGRGRGRGRDPNAEPLPPSTAQPLRRDEQAFQRQMAIQSAQSLTPRTFGGSLTAGPTPAQSRTPAVQEPSSQTVRPSANAEAVAQGFANIDLSSQSTSSAEQARALRHRVVIERASTMLQSDSTKLGQFRNSVSYFKTNAITATALIESFFALFSDTTSSALGTLVREVADLYEDKAKSDSLRTAWNDWRAINEDYPSLPVTSNPNSSSIPLGWANKAGAGSSSSTGQSASSKSTRVLKLKSSTAQSSRSSVSQTRSWGGSTTSTVQSAQPSNPYPSLPPPPGSASRTGKGNVNTIPWIASASAPSSNPPSAPTSRPASRAAPRKGQQPGGDNFPALPPAAKPQSSIFGYGSGMVRRDGGRGTAPSFSWGGQSGGSGEGSGAGGEDGEDEQEGKGRKKGNRGKKQIIMNWG